MPHYFRAVAIDYDGTLADGNAPSTDALAMIAEAREDGLCVILVTGRILDALRVVFPSAEARFDAIVAENGAVVWTPHAGARMVAEPVPALLADMLAQQGIPIERGHVILGTDVTRDRSVLNAITSLGLEAQLIRNRQALMVLPPGISKGTGLRDALSTLGISSHNTIAVGDAENDHSLLETCELGIAVANAIPALQAHADVVLHEADGAGITELLRGPLLGGEFRVQPRRWQARVGVQSDGTAVTVPGSQVNLLITGGPVSGKSCFAGLLAERLVDMGYAVCILDPEGDHIGLESLRDVIVTGGRDPLPTADHLARLFRHRSVSVVIDLSLKTEQERVTYCRHALGYLGRLRRKTGLPHWIILDEAHLVPNPIAALSSVEGTPVSGLCLVTYHPAQLAPASLAEMDLAIALLRGDGAEWQATLTAAGFPSAHVDLATTANDEWQGRAIILDRRSARTFTVDRRVSSHVRHWHKYANAALPSHRRFYFRQGPHLTGATAANIGEFHEQVTRCTPDVIRHHAGHGDFSRWIDDVIQDQELARGIHEVEMRLADGSEDVEHARQRLLRTVEARYEASGPSGL